MSEIPINDLYVFGLSPKVLNSLELMYFDSNTTAISTAPLTTESLALNDELLVAKEIKESNLASCKTCEFTETDPDLVKEHYKSDFHRFNLKRKVNQLPAVSEDEFEKLVDELDESISGSETSDDEEEKLDTIFEKATLDLDALEVKGSNSDEGSVSFMHTKSPFILFKSSLLPPAKCLGVFKSTFSSELLLKDPLAELKLWNSVDQAPKISALFMIGGGHFAGAIISHKRKSVKGFVGPQSSLLEQSVDLLEHKTFHRYTTRKKQGGSQSASDNARGKAKSAGSSLRRYNEAALEKEVRELLQSWKKHLDKCESIFVRANGSANRGILVGYEGAALQSSDPRIRSFPFTTKRATTAELKKAWINLTYANVSDIPKTDEKARARLLKEQQVLANSTKTTKKETVEKSVDEKHTEELVTLMKKSKVPAFVNYLKKNKIPSDFELQPLSEYQATPSLLHYAAANGLSHIVHVLLVNIKASPVLANHLGKTPYDIASSKQVRQVFRVARFNLGESYCDWKSAHVGEPKSKELFQEEENLLKKEEELEKRKLVEQELAKHKQESAQERVKKFGAGKPIGVVTAISNDLSQLTEEQKLRLMREQRARAAEERMKRMMNSK